MGFALFALSSLCQPLRRIAVSMRPRPAHHRPPVAAGAAGLAGAQASNDPYCAAITGPAARQTATASTGTERADLMPGSAPAAAAPRPLRVILNHHEGKTCRLVISGRMADVCAELNRLVLH